MSTAPGYGNDNLVEMRLMTHWTALKTVTIPAVTTMAGEAVALLLGVRLLGATAIRGSPTRTT